MKLFLLKVILNILIEIVITFYADNIKNIVYNDYINGRIENNIILNEYHFMYEMFGGVLFEFCDPLWFGEERCDPIITHTSCTIKPNCITEVQKRLPKDNLQSLQCYDSWDPALCPIKKWTNLSNCDSMIVYRGSNKNYEYLYYPYTFYLGFYYKWHFQSTTLFDNNFGSSPNNMYACENILRNNLVFNYKYHERTVTSIWVRFIYVTSKVVIDSTFKCAKYFHDPYCSLYCKDDHRRKCVEKYNFKEIETYETCQIGWILILYNINFMVPSCYNAKEENITTISTYRCLFLDKCFLNPNLCTGYGNYCIISGNGTHVCAQAKPIFTSNLYPNVDNASHTFVTAEEIITLKLYAGNIVPELYDCSFAEWIHIYNLTVLTPTKYLRKRKNLHLEINGSILTISTKILNYDYDYAISCLLNLANDYKIIELLINYTIVDPPKEITLENILYVIYQQEVMFSSNGFPKEFLFYDVLLNNEDFLNYSKMSIVKIPSTIFFGDVRMNITSHIDPPDYVLFSYWRQFLISVRAYKYFNWRLSNKMIVYNKDVIYCDVDMIVSFKMKISQLYGETIVDMIEDVKLTVNNFKAGVYKFICILESESFNGTFIKIKTIQVYHEFTEICFLPFGPVKGMLIKCVTNHYPRKQGNFKMNILQLPRRNVITSSDYDLLRIPYYIDVTEKYLVTCNYTYINRKDEVISKYIELYFSIADSEHVNSIDTPDSCLSYGQFPQEYDFFYNSNFKIIFFNPMYYLVTNPETNESFSIILLIIVFLCQFPVFPFQYWLRKHSDHEVQSQVNRSVEFINKRRKVRFLNEKAVSKLNNVNLEMKDGYSAKFKLEGFFPSDNELD